MALSKHKRPLEFSTSTGEDGGQRQSKRPAPLMSNMQNHGSNGSPGHLTLDDIRQVVGEGWKQAMPDLIELIDSRIQIALAGLIPQISSILKHAIRELVCKGMDHPNPQELNERILQNSNQITDTRNMQLRFNSKLSCPFYNTIPLQEQLECPIQVELIDTNTGRVVSSGPESCALLDVVVLRGDFKKESQDTWSVQDFEEGMVKERKGKRPLLIGELQVKLEEGIGNLGNVTFTDNSCWTPSRKFRLGVKVASGFCEGVHVREAITEEFTVLEYRGKAYEKHDEPASDDEIWRLKEIGKDGPYCKRLNAEGIYKVEEFVRQLVGDPKKLRNILGKGTPDKKWNVLIEHAKKCVPDGKSYAYYIDDKKENGVVINNLCQLKGLIADRKHYRTDQLPRGKKDHADNLVKAASKNWKYVKEYPESLLPGKSLPACPLEVSMNQQLCGNLYRGHLILPSFPGTQNSEVPWASLEPVSGDSTVGIGNVDQSAGTIPQFLIPSHRTNPSSMILEQDANPQNQQENFGNENVPHDSSSSSSFEEFLSSCLNFEGNCMAENEDKQNLWNDLGTESSSYPQVGRNSTKGISRGAVAWLMLKAMFMWGCFVKKGVEIIELD